MSGLHDVRQLRLLAGLDDQRVTRVRAAIQHLDVITTKWSTFTPRPAALADAVRQAEAVARELRQLQSAIAAEGSHDAD